MKKYWKRIKAYLRGILEETKTFIFDKGLKLSKPWAVFFWILLGVTLIYVFITWVTFFEFYTQSGKMVTSPSELQYAYLILLSIYATSNHVVKYWILQSGRVIDKPGGLFVFMWFVTFCVMMVLGSIYDESFTIPEDLTSTFLAVVGIFFGSKGVKTFILDKIKKLQPPTEIGE